MINMYNDDCMKFMRSIPDKHYDLAIVDPQYGIGQNWSKDRKGKHYKHRHNFNDTIPDKEYFDELLRISEDYIIWGINYFWQYFEPTNNLIFWDKGIDPATQHMSAGELALTSIPKYRFNKVFLWWCGAVRCEETERIHPHQKPVALYRWLLNNYAQPGYKIFDSHGGSGSICIACDELGFDLDWVEKDKKYYDDAVIRYQN